MNPGVNFILGYALLFYDRNTKIGVSSTKNQFPISQEFCNVKHFILPALSEWAQLVKWSGREVGVEQPFYVMLEINLKMVRIKWYQKDRGSERSKVDGKQVDLDQTSKTRVN